MASHFREHPCRVLITEWRFRAGASAVYLTNLLILNSGPLADLEIVPEFHANGNPKPLVLVGGNGCGKTNVLSIVADALVELAALHFSDVMPQRGASRAIYRLLGPSTMRLGSAFELSAARFSHEGVALGYRAVIGTVDPAVVPRMSFHPELGQGLNGQASKTAFGDSAQIERIFRSGAYCFMPSNRAEAPAWLNSESGTDEPTASFAARTTSKLRKPLINISTLDSTKAWLIDVILDQSLDSATVLDRFREGQPGIARLSRELTVALQELASLQAVNAILSEILKEQGARIVRAGRGAGDRKIHIQIGDHTAIPTLESLSAGQATLLSIFSTVLRYGDQGQAAVRADQIEGVVLVDEIDAHLHADLQHDILPRLIAMFPKVQFIVTSHAPLFPLGMERSMGSEAFTLIELPTGTRIGAERFSEFEASYRYLRDTKAFEEDVRNTLAQRARPSVICEGETDPIYVKAAAELLGYNNLAAQVEFDWIGQRTGAGAEGGGKDELTKALRFLKLNPSFVQNPVVLLYDADAKKPDEVVGNLFVLSLPDNAASANANGGVEVLLPDALFEERFYRATDRLSGTTRSTKKELLKMDLCRFVCEERREPADFELFRPILDAISAALGIAEQAA